MELRRLLGLVKKWFWLIVIAGVLGAAVGTGIAALQKKIYEANTIVYVSTPSRSDWNNIIGDQQAAKAFSLFPTSTPILKAALTALGDTETLPAQLLPMITVNNTRETQFVTIQVRTSDPQRASQLANELAKQSISAFAAQTTSPDSVQTKTFVKEEAVRLETQIKDTETTLAQLQAQAKAETDDTKAAILKEDVFKTSQRLNWLQQAHREMVDSFSSLNNTQPRIMQEAEIPTKPLNSSPMLSIIIGVLGGLVVIVAVIIMIEQTDEVLRTSDRVVKASGLSTYISIRPVLPKPRLHLLPAKTDSSISQIFENYQLPEAFLTLGAFFYAQRQQLVAQGETANSLLITSPEDGNGKTFSASQIALGLARVGIDVILIDANLRAPCLHKVFGLSNQVGLTTVLQSNEATTLEEALCQTHDSHLYILPSGPLTETPAELLSSAKMTSLLHELSERALVVIDSPSILRSSEAVILANKTDSILVVVDARHTVATKLTNSLEILKRVNPNVLGVVLNQAG